MPAQYGGALHYIVAVQRPNRLTFRKYTEECGGTITCLTTGKTKSQRLNALAALVDGKKRKHIQHIDFDENHCYKPPLR